MTNKKKLANEFEWKIKFIDNQIEILESLRTNNSTTEMEMYEKQYEALYVEKCKLLIDWSKL